MLRVACSGQLFPTAPESDSRSSGAKSSPQLIPSASKPVNLHLSQQEIQNRLAQWEKPVPRYTRGVLAKYAKTVSSASEGAVTDKFQADLP